MGGMKTKSAVFLDRDGTIIDHVHYLREPMEHRLMPFTVRLLTVGSVTEYRSRKGLPWIRFHEN